MASEDSSLPLWDSENPEQQCLVLYTLRYGRCLHKNKSKLKQLIKLGRLCPCLLNQGIIDTKGQIYIQQGATDKERVERLLTSIQEGPCWRLHGLLKALCEGGQEEVVELLGLDPGTYRGTSQEHSAAATSTETTDIGQSTGSQEQETLDLPEESDHNKRQNEDQVLDTKKEENVKRQLGTANGNRRELSPTEEEQEITTGNAKEEQDSNTKDIQDTKTQGQDKKASSSKIRTDAEALKTDTVNDEEKDLYQEKESTSSDIQRQPADGSSLQEHTDANAESQKRIMPHDESEIPDEGRKMNNLEPVTASERQSAGSAAEHIDVTGEKQYLEDKQATVNQAMNQKQNVDTEHEITDEHHAKTVVSSKNQQSDSSTGTKELNKYQDSSKITNEREDSRQQVEHTASCHVRDVSSEEDAMHREDIETCCSESNNPSTEKEDVTKSFLSESDLSQLTQDEQIQYAMMLSMEESPGKSHGANLLIVPNTTLSTGTRDVQSSQKSYPTAQNTTSTEEGFGTTNVQTHSQENEGGHLQDLVGLQEDITLKEQPSEGNKVNNIQRAPEDSGGEIDVIQTRVSDGCRVQEKDSYHEFETSSNGQTEPQVEDGDSRQKHSTAEHINTDAQPRMSLPREIQITQEGRKRTGQELVTGSIMHSTEHTERTDEGAERPFGGEEVIDSQGYTSQTPAVEVGTGHETSHEIHDKTAEEVGSHLENTDSGFVTCSFVDCSTATGGITEGQDKSKVGNEYYEHEQPVEGTGSIEIGSDRSQDHTMQAEDLQVCSQQEDTSVGTEKDKCDLDTSYLSEADLSNLSETEQIEYAMMLSTQESSGKDTGESLEVVPYRQPTASGEADDEIATANAVRVMQNMVEETDPFDQIRHLVELASIFKDLSEHVTEGSDEEQQPQVMVPTIYYLDLSMMTTEDQLEYAMYKSLPADSSLHPPIFSQPSIDHEEQVQVKEVFSIADVSKMTEDQQLEYAMKISSQPSTAKNDVTALDKQHHETKQEEDEGEKEEEGRSLNFSSEPSSTVKNVTQSDVLKNAQPQDVDQGRVSNAGEERPSVDSGLPNKGADIPTVTMPDATQLITDDSERAAMSMKERIKRNTVNFVDTLDVRLFEHLLQPHLARVTQEHETRMDKARSLLDQLRRDPEEQSITFLHVISGLYPELVTEVTSRKPTRPQADICIRGFCGDLKTVIKEMGNIPDSKREKICLDNQYIQLRLVKDKQKSLEEQKTTEAGSDSSGDEDEAIKLIKGLLEEFTTKDDEAEPDQEQGSENVLPDMYQGYLEGSIQHMEPNDIILNLKSGGMVLLRGRAGIGKTTFVQWLVRQWQLGRWAKEFTIVFVLNLRYLARLDYSMTLSELLTQYSVYNTSQVHPQFQLWMANSANRMALIIEGLDELSRLEHLLAQTKPIQNGADVRAKPVEWVINIIRCNILPSCCKIVTSRPFTALKTLEPDRTVELLGLTRSAVKEFIKRNVREEKQQHVEHSLETNPHLMSSCGITFYCAAICRLLEEGVIFSDVQLNTYTRITSFMILKMALRQEPDAYPGPAGCAQALGDVLAPLARLARYGLMQGNETEKLVFGQADFLKAKISKPEQIAMEKSGLIPSMTIKDPHRGEHLLAEYLHLSIQEILAMAEILQSDDSQIEDALRRMSHTGRFNMAELFVVGLALDKESEWVTSLRDGVGLKLPEGKTVPDAASKVRDFCLDMVKDDPDQDQSMYLRGIQATYESQDVELAKNMSKKFGLQEDVMISNTPLTSIDVNGLLFVLHHTENIHSVMLTDVNLDDWSLELLLRFMSERKTIERLNLTGNQITDNGLKKLFNEAEFPQLKNRFTVISLRGNQITDQGIEAVSKSLSENTSLTSLNLSHNPISDVGAESLCTVLLHNATLETLNLRGTTITNNGLLSLMEAVSSRGKSIDLRVSAGLGTDLQRVLDKGGVLKDETTLKLSRAGITTKGIAHLAKVLEQDKCQLSSLNLGHNHLTDEDADHLCDVIKTATPLMTLNLEETKITNNGLLALLVAINDRGKPVSVRFSRQLNEDLREILENGGLLKAGTTLNLNHARLNGKGIGHLAVLLKSTSAITGLNLSHNDLTDEGMETLATVLCNNTSLEVIELQVASITNNGLLALVEAVNKRGKPLNVSVSDQLNEDLRGVLQNGGLLTKETKMNLNHSEVTQKGIKHLAALLDMNVKITSLRLAGSSIDMNAAMMLCEALMVNTSLQLLELSHNQICDTGAQKVAEVMLVNTNLQDLRLSHCRITDTGVETLTEAMKATTMGLQNLELSFNKITDKGAGKLALALEERNTSLQKLELSGNQIGDEGTGKLAKALAVNASLSHLELSYNRITDDAAETLADAVARNTTLQELSLSGNQITDAGAQKLASALQTNTNMKCVCLAWNKIAVVEVEKQKRPKWPVLELRIGNNIQGDSSDDSSDSDDEADSASEAASEAAVEPSNEAAVEPSNEAAVEPSNEAAVEQSNEAAVEPSNEAAVEQSNEAAVEPSNEAAVEPSNEAAVEPSNEAAVEPASKAAMEPSNEAAVEPLNEAAVEQSNEAAVEPSNEAAVEPSNEAAVEPSNEAAMEQSNEAAVEPSNEAAVEPASKAATELASNDAAEPQSDAALDTIRTEASFTNGKAQEKASEKLDVNAGTDGSKDSIKAGQGPLVEADPDTLDSDAFMNTEADAIDVHVPTSGDAEDFKTEVRVVYSTRL